MNPIDTQTKAQYDTLLTLYELNKFILQIEN